MERRPRFVDASEPGDPVRVDIGVGGDIAFASQLPLVLPGTVQTPSLVGQLDKAVDIPAVVEMQISHGFAAGPRLPGYASFVPEIPLERVAQPLGRHLHPRHQPAGQPSRYAVGQRLRIQRIQAVVLPKTQIPQLPVHKGAQIFRIAVSNFVA